MKVIELFSAYPLQTSKVHHFEAFREVYEIMKAKGHLTTVGLERVIALKGIVDRRSRVLNLQKPSPT